LKDGQTPEDYGRVPDKLAHAWKIHVVRLASWKPGKVTLAATG
jgi:S-DNA-T family DNA segregation ATPase FtsK/SpoIIIE